MEVNKFIICGARRSGTTLLNAILCSDSQCNPLGQEAQLLTRLIESYQWGKMNFDSFGQSFFDDLQQYQTFYQEVIAKYTQEISSRISAGDKLVLKNPELCLCLSDVLELLENAIFLVTVRDPRDQICSEIEVTKRRLSDVGENIDLADRRIGRLAKQYNKYYEQLLGSNCVKRVNLIKYEDLVKNPKTVLKQISSITGLSIAFDPNAQWLRVSPLAGLRKSASRSELYDSPITQCSVGRHVRELTNEEINQIERICENAMRTFGYGNQSGDFQG